MTPLLGLTIDILVFATVFVYMPIANYCIKHKPKWLTDTKEIFKLILAPWTSGNY